MSGDALKALAEYRYRAIKGGRYVGHDKLIVDAILELGRITCPEVDRGDESKVRTHRLGEVVAEELRRHSEIIGNARRSREANKCHRCNGGGFIEVGPDESHPCGFCDASGEVEHG